ncbi:guanine nucleotide-binding protein subunit beta-like protein 1 [Babylonia areolata]|uniref:guanine nucleotide-binding protein subunit beta-like protein 1 n=1 Tax=Babylonia areolata TaxID=304850 RepID=UPI003FD0E744
MAADNKANTGLCAPPPPSPVYILHGSGSPVTVLEFSDHADGSLLSGCQNGQVHLWDLSTRRSHHSFDAHDGQPVLFVTSAASDMLMTHGRDGYFKMWKCTGSSYILHGKLEADGDGFCTARVLTQENTSPLVAIPSKNSTIQLFDLNSQSPVRTLTPQSGCDELGLCMCMCVIPNQTGFGTCLVAGYESGKMILWDVCSGKALHECCVHDDAVMCLSFSSAKMNKGLSGSVDERLVVWRISNEGKIEIIRKIECINPGFNDISLRSDDRIVATAGWDKQVRLFSMKSMRPLAILAYHRESVRCVRFSKDCLLAAGSNDHLISLWDVYRRA